ncbi:MAG: MBL fold metallo-hydrolase [Verrucomicrobia bacterium]|nr:MBL fold metallo-hydrolase [Verrucomicrobiota bacterium]MCH8512880.1 MBL fold metallo-hydrolase [Kiritimatiellia bacterium]
MKLTFLGASRNVTGSRTMVETGGSRILIDCGYFQERKFQDRNWDEFPVPPSSIDVVLLTHAHLDHTGLLPRLVAQGFRGKILATHATCDIAAIILRDSARLQQEDVRQKQKRHQKEGRTSKHPYRALYDPDDAEDAIQQFSPVEFQRPVEVAPGVSAVWYEAGHILGAASIRLEVTEGAANKSILFSGDVGRKDMPLIRDPVTPHGADTLVMESTYGDRDHDSDIAIADQLAKVINETHEAGGNLVIPSFAVERAQDILYHFTRLLRAKKIPPTLVFLDSPMAVRVTEVFKRHESLFDAKSRAMLEQGDHPCDFPGLKMARTREQSKAINQIKGTICVIAGSGMCTGGRIKHHLLANLARPESTILFVGYQAEGTLGRQILRKPQEVRIHGQMLPVRARIAQIQGFSGHADRGELRRWLDALDPKPNRIFLNHGEESVANGFAEALTKDYGIETSAPEYQSEIEL